MKKNKNKKSIRKTAALLLAFLLVFSLSLASVSADEPDQETGSAASGTEQLENTDGSGNGDTGEGENNDGEYTTDGEESSAEGEEGTGEGEEGTGEGEDADGEETAEKEDKDDNKAPTAAESTEKDPNETDEAEKAPALMDANAALAFTVQPESATVSYPASVQFHAEVNKPASDVTWQWYCEDNEKNVYELSGATAKTDTLKRLSTMSGDSGLKYYCTVTDKKGNSITSDKATLVINNTEEKKTVLYIGEMALEPNQSLNLAETKYGKGVITFAENGTDITFDNVDINNSWVSCSRRFNTDTFVTLFRDGNTNKQYNIILKGSNTIQNVNKDINSSITVNFEFLGRDVYTPALFVVQGSGSLTIKGGTVGLRALGDLQLNAPVSVVPQEKYNEGLIADHVTVSSGITLDLNVCGTAIQAGKGLDIQEGAVVKVKTTSPYVAGASTEKAAISVTGDVTMNKAAVDITAEGDPTYLVPGGEKITGFYGFMLSGKSQFKAVGSTIGIKMTAKASDTAYANNFIGIHGNDSPGIALESSKVSITIDSENIHEAMGIYTAGALSISDKSTVDVTVRASDKAYGIAPEGELTVSNSNITVNTEEVNGKDSYGVLCGSANITETESYQFKSTAKEGVAFAAKTGESGTDQKGYDSTYKAKKITLNDNTACILPINNAISLGSMPGGKGWMYLETFYSLDDTSKPANAVVLSVKQPVTAAYAFDSSSETTWIKESADGMKLLITRNPDDSAAFSHFTGIEMDESPVGAEHYTAESGSVKLTLSAAYLDTLESGNHTLKAVFDDGSAAIDISVKIKMLISVRGNTELATYSGVTQTTTGCKASSTSKLFDINKIKFVEGKHAKAEGIDVGTYQMGLAPGDFTYLDDTVIPEFSVTDGYLEISPAELTVTTASASKTYDGTPLTSKESKVEGLENDEKVTIKTTGSQTEVGSSKNTYEITWDTAKQTNYTVEDNLGTLTVKEKGSSGGSSSGGSSSKGSSSNSGSSSSSKNVKTGDENNMTVWIIIIIAGGLGVALAGFMMYRRRK